MIDHIGRINAALGLDQHHFEAIRHLMDHPACWIKVSGIDRITRKGPPYADAIPFARTLVSEYTDRLSGATNWPHPNHQGPIPDDDELVRGSLTSHRTNRHGAALMVTNPARLYGFGKTYDAALQRQIAIVTGAGCVGPGWGNGRAIAVRLAEEGATVVACDRDLSRVEETIERAGALGSAIIPQACDVTSSASIAETVETCVARFGKVDVLVNNVGGSAAGGPVD